MAKGRLGLVAMTAMETQIHQKMAVSCPGAMDDSETELSEET